MMKFHALPRVLFVFSLALSACSFAIPQPTPTAKPSDTPLPTSTPTPSLTYTPIPTNTPTMVLPLGNTMVVKIGGYSFRTPLGYPVDVRGAQASIFDNAGTLAISIYGGTSNPQKLSPDAIADLYLAAVFKNGNGEYVKGTPRAITIDGVGGSAYDITGTLTGVPLRGQAIIVMPNNDQYLFGLGLSKTANDEKQWENEGSNVFQTLINSIKFLTAEQTNAAGSCVVSADRTYGYTEENPIKVGGGDFDGPPRERAYLDNLMGPKGEIISYERIGSMPFGDTILDAYVITGLNNQVTLYIDEYSYTEPQAPVGFTCVSSFPLTEP